MNNQEALARAADRLEEAAKGLEQLRESLTDGNTDEELRRLAADTMLAVLGGIIESVAGIGETLRVTVTKNEPHQCPECGLPIGTNTSSPCSAGCLTCNEVKGTCPDCNCPLGENSLNCNTCARATYV